MSPEDRIRLAHMIEAAEQAITFAHGRTRRDFDDDKQLQFAVIHAVQIVLEAASQVTKGLRDATPDIAWTQMIGMRHRVVHAYLDVDPHVIWATVWDDLPTTLITLRKLVGEP